MLWRRRGLVEPFAHDDELREQGRRVHDRLGESQRWCEWVLREDGARVEMVLWLCFSGAAREFVTGQKEKTGPRTA